MTFPSRFRLSRSVVRRGLSMRWSPLLLKPYWWFDTSDLGSLTFDVSVNSTTTSWRDKSGNARNTALGTAVNNQPFVYGPRPGDKIFSNHYHVPGTALPSTMPITIFAVWTPGDSNATDPYIVLGGAAGCLSLRFENATYKASVLRSAQAMVLASNLVGNARRPNVIGTVVQTSGAIVHLNGREESNGTNANISAVTAAIGHNTNNGESAGSNAYCHEFLAWSGRALDKNERDLVAGYLAWKWNVPEMSASNPYRYRPPMARPGWNDRKRLNIYLNAPASVGGGGGRRRKTGNVSSL